LNKEGFRKILKKHDKEWKTDGGLQYFNDIVKKSYFVQSKKIDDLILKTEVSNNNSLSI
jgi:SPX domain protein involved in polyphosphate accumulation